MNERQIIWGAIIVSSAASLSLHLMPFIVLSLISSKHLLVGQAGYVASAFLFGQLASVLLLPSVGVRRVSWSFATISVLTIAFSILSSHWFLNIYFSWWIVGVMCGVLQFLGVTAASLAKDKRSAFGLRTAVSLLLGDFVIIIMNFTSVLNDYQWFSRWLAFLVLIIASAGLYFYRVPPLNIQSENGYSGLFHGFWGLLILLVFFSGQIGFYVYLMYGGQSKGIHIEEYLIAIALCKMLAAVIICVLLTARSSEVAKHGFLKYGLLLVSAVLILSQTTNPILFVLGLLFWEVGMNVLSSRFQAAIVERNSIATGPWVAGAVFLGSAVGPSLNGVAIENHGQFVFYLFAIACALLPWLWSLAGRGFAR